MNNWQYKTGVVVNCLKCHIHEAPNLESEIVCKIRFLTEVLVDEENSTDQFYKICTAIGAEGFCERKLITIRQ